MKGKDMANTPNVSDANANISPVVPTPAKPDKEKVATRPRYMPPSDNCARKGVFTLPSGNKVTNA